ncbi:hypothetical protein QSV34_15065 [Porticoccus sp. W117]|uniref:hypothetical protein n=1 Tax=Porticoccus sp. W117 TaxID=3054777 RepID=UPI0025928BE3|nr:hypothetical protein [Porticoccus sp. W117]MDM3872671.1 hypothetical protein [Porticoccus sp. W117]
MFQNIYRESCNLILNTDCSNREIARRLGGSHNTYGKYRKRLQKLGMSWQEIEKLADSQIKLLLLPQIPHVSDKPEPDWHYVDKLLNASKYQTLEQLHEEYAASHQEDGMKYSTFTKRYRAFKKTQELSMRIAHYPGECIYVDYAGTLIRWTHA